MDISGLQIWAAANPVPTTAATFVCALLAFLVARNLVGRSLVNLSARTKTQADDILIRNIHPYRVAWFAPLAVIYFLAPLLPAEQVVLQKTSLLLMLWLGVFGLADLLDAFNQIYESSSGYKGVSVQGYLDIAKIFAFGIGLILSFSILTDQSPTLLLGGLTALTAVLLLIFRDTLLSIVASVQIVTQDLFKEGDWLTVPDYDADGDVINISLHSVKIQNFDQTVSVIPTYKLMEIAFKNWRSMQESGGRRIKRAIHIDQGSIRFCNREMLERYRRVDLLEAYLDERIRELDRFIREGGAGVDFPLDGPQLTNLGVYRVYIEAYLRSRPEIHDRERTLLVRPLSPGPTGLPVEVYAFARTVDWAAYEQVQGDIFDHLIAAAPFFDLRVFQEPTGMDLAALGGALSEGERHRLRARPRGNGRALEKAGRVPAGRRMP